MGKKDITERVKSYEDACSVLGIYSALPEFPALRQKDRAGLEAYYKLVVIARALNEGWEPNWADEDEYKYAPYFYFDRKNNKTAGLAHAHTYSAPSNTNASIGSRLCFKTKALAKYAATQFETLYNDYILYPHTENPSSDDTTRRDLQGAEKVGASETAPEDFAAVLKAAAEHLNTAADRESEGNTSGFVLMGGTAPEKGGTGDGLITMGGARGMIVRMLAEFLAAPQTQELITEAIDHAGGIMLRRKLAGNVSDLYGLKAEE